MSFQPGKKILGSIFIVMSLFVVLPNPLWSFVNKNHIQSQLQSIQDDLGQLVQIWEGATVDHRHRVTKDLDQNLEHISGQLGQLRQTMAGPHTQDFDPSIRDDLRKAQQETQNLRQMLQGLAQVEANNWPTEQRQINEKLENLLKLMAEAYRKFREPFEQSDATTRGH
ncbi:MAG: hypothetical protein ACOH5I_01975 [Oligoflexus sp.]